MKFKEPQTLQQIASLLKVEFVGDANFKITGINEIHVVEAGDIVFVDHPKYYKKALSKFEKFLKDTFSLTPEGYYTKLIGGLGLSFGLLFGVAILSNLERSLGISLGLIGGMVIGSIIGRTKDAEVKKAGNML